MFGTWSFRFGYLFGNWCLMFGHLFDNWNLDFGNLFLTMNLIFKKAIVIDIPIITLLAEKIWMKYYTSIISIEQIRYMLDKMYSPGSIEHQMKEGQEYTLVYDDKEPLGYISISSKDERNYFLHKFYVDTAKHRKGIGKKLFDHMLSTMNKPESIELTVNRQNFKAINFYFKMGFTIDSVADFDIGSGYFMNDFVMIRN